MFSIKKNGGKACSDTYVLIRTISTEDEITLVTNSNDRLVKLCEIRRN